MSRNLKLILLIILAGTVAVYVITVVIPSQLAKRSYEAAKSIGQDMSKAFQFTPEVIMNNTIVLNKQTPILELATLSQNFHHTYTWENSWLRSKKQIIIAGSFEAKVGFDLSEKFSLHVQDDRVIVYLSQPKILSVEPLGDMTFHDEDGIWNWVNEEDRAKATNAFITDARRYAQQATFIQDAQTQMEARIREIMATHDKSVEFRYTEVLGEPR
jgi:hypothetical protein